VPAGTRQWLFNITDTLSTDFSTLPPETARGTVSRGARNNPTRHCKCLRCNGLMRSRHVVMMWSRECLGPVTPVPAGGNMVNRPRGPTLRRGRCARCWPEPSRPADRLLYGQSPKLMAARQSQMQSGPGYAPGPLRSRSRRRQAAEGQLSIPDLPGWGHRYRRRRHHHRRHRHRHLDPTHHRGRRRGCTAGGCSRCSSW
jgi:hypothetical protein